MGFSTFKQQIIRLLHWSERYTKTDMVYLLQGSFWMMMRQMILSLIAFGMAIAFANLLPKETYGAYKYVLSMSILLAMTTMSGINTSLTRSVAQGYEGSMVRALYTRIKYGMVGSLLTLTIALYYGIQENSILSAVFFIVAIFLPLKSSFSVYQSYWQGKQRFDLFSKLSMVQELLAAVPLLITLLVTDDLFLIILAYFCSQTLASVFLFVCTWRRVENQKRDPELIPLGRHLSISGMFYAIANNSTDIILWHLLGPVPVAVYAFATRPPQELRRLFTEAFPIALPKFSQRSKEEIQNTLMKKIGKLYLVLVPCVVAYMIVAPWVYVFFFPAYQEAIVYSQVFSLTILFAPLSLFGIVFQALRRTREMYLISVMSPILLVTALLIFVPLYGLMGAIVALLTELVLQTMVVVYLFKRM